MKTTAFTTLICTLLATSFSSAAPTERANTVSFQLANDYTGHYANVNVPADGVKHMVASLFAGTAIDVNGSPIATSAMLTAFQQDTTCTLSQNPALVVTLTAEKTWASLEQGSQINLYSAYLVCKD
jgi:hypothetical protein